MIKKTLCFSNPARLSLTNGQLVIKLAESTESQNKSNTIPIEDIGIVLLDHQQITITHAVINALLENNAAIITCDSKHMPLGLLMPLSCNTLQSERFINQIDASVPLKKQLWQQTVSQKIRNQAAALKKIRNVEIGNMLVWSSKVKSGDSENLEGRAAVYYWAQLLADKGNCTRDRDGNWPNPLLNYSYSIIRAMVARALVASGMLPTLGIHHHNRYNAYCLADDIMEPYRPYADILVFEIMDKWPNKESIDTNMKRELLSIPVMDVIINGQRSPMMIAISQTTASLYKCFSGELRKIIYPEIPLL